MTLAHHVALSAEFDAPATALWRVISDFPHIDRWAALNVISTAGSGPGSTRTVELASGAQVTERMLRCDDAAMILLYEAVEPNPFPMHEYRSTMTVMAISSDRCRLEWSGAYVPPPGSDPSRADKLLRKVYEGGIALLRDHLAGKLAQ